MVDVYYIVCVLVAVGERYVCSCIKRAKKRKLYLCHKPYTMESVCLRLKTDLDDSSEGWFLVLFGLQELDVFFLQ